jgi:ferredoxin
MRNIVVVLVDLNRCQSYGQCVFAAPAVFRLPHTETLEWDYEPPPGEAERVERARHACPVQAITVTAAAGTDGDAAAHAGSSSGSVPSRGRS